MYIALAASFRTFFNENQLISPGLSAQSRPRCYSLWHPLQACRLALNRESFKSRFLFPVLQGQDKIWLPSSFDQRDANASQLSRFNFSFNPSFQAMTGLLFQPTSDSGPFFYEDAVVFVTHTLCWHGKSRLLCCQISFFSLLPPHFMIWGLGSGNVTPRRKWLVLWVTLDTLALSRPARCAASFPSSNNVTASPRRLKKVKVRLNFYFLPPKQLTSQTHLAACDRSDLARVSSLLQPASHILASLQSSNLFV